MSGQRRLVAGIALVACAAAVAVAWRARQQDFNPQDLSGVWAIATPIGALQTTTGAAPPLNDAGLALHGERQAQAATGDYSWDITRKCQPPGEPRAYMENGWPFQIGQSPERVVFMFQWNRLVRVVEMGRELPEYDGPFYFGRSSGRWEDGTLIVDVIGLRNETTLDASGLPHGEDMKLQQRFRLLDRDTLEVRIRFEDAMYYREPWESVLRFKRQPEDAIVEDHCLDRVPLQNSYRPKLT